MKRHRIFLVIGGKATPVATSSIWIRNFYDPLVALGHDVHLLDIDAYAQEHGLGYMSPEAKERLSADLPGIFLREHRKQPFDICFSYLHSGQIRPEVLTGIKKEVYTVNYTTNFHQFDLYREVTAIADCSIYISKMAKPTFDTVGAKSYWMPLAANPQFYQPSDTKNEDVVFVGSVYGPRPYLFYRLLQYGVNLHLYGFGWKAEAGQRRGRREAVNRMLHRTTGYELRRPQHKTTDALRDTLQQQYLKINETVLEIMRKDYGPRLHPGLSDDEYAATLANAWAVVNIQESRFGHHYAEHQVLFGANLRDFETTMGRTLLFTQYSEEVAELFAIDKEIVCYHNEHDLAEKIAYYTTYPAEGAAIAQAGYERSLADHTWERRFTDFFNFLAL